VYKRINLSPDGKYLLGGVLIGDADAYNLLLQTVNNKVVLPPHPEDLILGARGGEASAGAGVMSLPEEALVCSCEAVTKGAICAAVTEQQVTSMEGMKKCNKAGTGCGGCVPMVKDLIHGTLTAQGAYIKNVLCEHFDFSRQELFDLLKINDIRTYDAALDHFGRLSRTPTTGTWPTSRRAAATRWCRALRAVRCRPSNSWSSGGSPRSTAFTPRLPAASASTCSGPTSATCPLSGRS
jgi:NAD(P)H-nitrite reductase large subunit